MWVDGAGPILSSPCCLLPPSLSSLPPSLSSLPPSLSSLPPSLSSPCCLLPPSLSSPSCDSVCLATQAQLAHSGVGGGRGAPSVGEECRARQVVTWSFPLLAGGPLGWSGLGGAWQGALLARSLWQGARGAPRGPQDEPQQPLHPPVAGVSGRTGRQSCRGPPALPAGNNCRPQARCVLGVVGQT